jgi:hypothetical protein
MASSSLNESESLPTGTWELYVKVGDGWSANNFVKMQSMFMTSQAAKLAWTFTLSEEGLKNGYATTTHLMLMREGVAPLAEEPPACHGTYLSKKIPASDTYAALREIWEYAFDGKLFDKKEIEDEVLGISCAPKELKKRVDPRSGKVDTFQPDTVIKVWLRKPYDVNRGPALLRSLNKDMHYFKSDLRSQILYMQQNMYEKGPAAIQSAPAPSVAKWRQGLVQEEGGWSTVKRSVGGGPAPWATKRY